MSSDKYFEIQSFRAAGNTWSKSISAPTHDIDVDEKAVWQAYVRYLSFAYPDVLYRLVEVTTEKKVKIIHV